MFKDPLHQEETPYDILSLTPTASQNEVHQALPKFMRDVNKMRRLGLGKAQEAKRKLQNPKDRIAIDIFYYSIGKMDGNGFTGQETDLDLSNFLVVPYLKPEEVYSDLDKENFSDDFREIKLAKVKLAELNEYDDLKHKKLEILPFAK